MSSTPKHQIWAGYFGSEALLTDLVREVWPEDDDDDDAPISAFVASQGQTWLDHDFTEVVWGQGNGDFPSRFAGMSHIGHWGAAAARRAEDLGLRPPDAIILVGDDDGVPRIATPQDAAGDGWHLTYLGRY